MGSVLIELNDLRSSHQSIFTSKGYQKLLNSDTPKKLVNIAIEQRNMLAA